MSQVCRRLRNIFSAKTLTHLPSPLRANAKRPVDSVKDSSSGQPLFLRNFRNFEKSILRLSRKENHSALESLLEDQKKYIEGHEAHAVRLMLLCGRVGMFERACKLFGEMPEYGCDRSALSLNALLEAAIRSEEWEMVDVIFRDFSKDFSLDANLVTYNTVIKAYCKMGCFHSAVSLLFEMEKKEIEPDVVTFNTILNGLYGSGNFLEGEKVWQLLLGKNVVPNVRSYNARLRGMVLERLIGDAVNLFEEMEKEGVAPDVCSYNALISGFCKSQNLDEAKKWHQRMVERGIHVDRVTVAVLIPFLCEKGEFEMVYGLCVEAIDKGLLKGTQLLQSAVDCLVRESQVELAKTIVVKGNSKNKYECSLELPLAEKMNSLIYEG